ALHGSEDNTRISPVLVSQKKRCRSFGIANNQAMIAAFLGGDTTRSFRIMPGPIEEIKKDTRGNKLAVLRFPDLEPLSSLPMSHSPSPTGFSDSAKTVLFTASNNNQYTVIIAKSANLQENEIVRRQVPGAELFYPYTDRELIIAWASQQQPRF